MGQSAPSVLWVFYVCTCVSSWSTVQLNYKDLGGHPYSLGASCFGYVNSLIHFQNVPVYLNFNFSCWISGPCTILFDRCPRASDPTLFAWHLLNENVRIFYWNFTDSSWFNQVKTFCPKIKKGVNVWISSILYKSSHGSGSWIMPPNECRVQSGPPQPTEHIQFSQTITFTLSVPLLSMDYCKKDVTPVR